MKIIRIICIVIGIIIIISVLAFVILRFVYPAILRANHKIKDPGIDVMETVEIGGVKQVLYLRGENIENPVILYLHGGPGSPMIPLLHGFQYDWEKDFTVVHWDQRNAGKTFYLNDPDEVLTSMSFERVLADAHEVTQYIKQKLNKDKIIILGHSWGSLLGTVLVQAYPQDYSAYIGVGQMVDISDMHVAYEKVLEVAHDKGNKRDVTALENLSPDEHFFEIRKYLNKYNLAEDMSFRLVMLAFTSPYNGFDYIRYYLGVSNYNYQRPLFDYLDEYDVRNYGTMYEVPVFYIMGDMDYQTPYPLAKEFFEEISAPVKMFFTMQDAGHMPMLDDKAEFHHILLEAARQLP